MESNLDILKQNKNKFDLFKHLDEKELLEFKAFDEIKLTYLNDLLKHVITQKNIYEILLIADCYQYNNMDELINDIQYEILKNKITINKKKLNKNNLYGSIYNSECIKAGKVLCDLEDDIHSVACCKYLTRGSKPTDYTLECIIKTDDVKLIKYFQEYCDYHECLDPQHDSCMLDFIYEYDSINIFKYFENNGYVITYDLEKAIEELSINIIKYLYDKGIKIEKNPIEILSNNNIDNELKYLQALKYLTEQNIKTRKHYDTQEDFNIDYELADDIYGSILIHAAENDCVDTIKYLTKCGYKNKNIVKIVYDEHNSDVARYLIDDADHDIYQYDYLRKIENEQNDETFIKRERNYIKYQEIYNKKHTNYHDILLELLFDKHF